MKAHLVACFIRRIELDQKNNQLENEIQNLQT